ncbi:MAG TPA: PilZ domain-containing protein [Kofleriaceae bacterium]
MRHAKTCQPLAARPSFRDVSRPNREHPRYAHEASVTLIERDGRTSEGRTANVSRGGLCADLPEPIAYGAEIDVDIILIFDEETQSEPLRVAGRVVWCTSVGATYQTGVRFKPMAEEQLEYLTMFLRYLDDGGPPTRIPRELTLDKRFD